MKQEKSLVLDAFPDARLQIRFFSLTRALRYRVVLAHVHGKKAQLTGWYGSEWGAWRAAWKKLQPRLARGDA